MKSKKQIVIKKETKLLDLLVLKWEKKQQGKKLSTVSCGIIQICRRNKLNLTSISKGGII